MRRIRGWRLVVCLLAFGAFAPSALAMPGDGLQRWRERIKHNPIVVILLSLIDPPPEDKISLPPA